MLTDEKRDPFLNDEDEKEFDESKKTFDAVREGWSIVTPQEIRNQILVEHDIPSIFLRGMIPGASSQDASEDPNFKKIRDAYGPEGVELTSDEIYEIQSASGRRYLSDDNYHGILDAYKVFIIGRGFHVS